MIIARFSNGFTDVYKGSRKVTAAWMITHAETGEVLASGHSLDRVRAGKTAVNTVMQVGYSKDDPPYLTVPTGGWSHPGFINHAKFSALKSGCDRTMSVREFWKRSNALAAQARRNRCVIEIVDISTS